MDVTGLRASTAHREHVCKLDLVQWFDERLAGLTFEDHVDDILALALENAVINVA